MSTAVAPLWPNTKIASLDTCHDHRVNKHLIVFNIVFVLNKKLKLLQLFYLLVLKI